jgi:pyruvate dehydrogenase E2 component (dihydrolipoamide acetyltransferase)
VTGEPITLVTIPMWGMTMIDAELRAWLIDVGDAVELGAPMAEIETEKLSGQVEAPCSGVVRRLIAGPGDVLPVGAPIGVIADTTTTEAEIDAFLASAAEDPGTPSA